MTSAPLRRRLFLVHLLLYYYASDRATATTGDTYLGKHALLLTGVNPLHALPVARACLAAGASSATLLIPLPRAGAISASDAARLLHRRIAIEGHNSLMQRLGFAEPLTAADAASAEQPSLGPRISWAHCRSDDIEELYLRLLECDVLLWPVADVARRALSAEEECARREMSRRLLRGCLCAARSRGCLSWRRTCVGGISARVAWLDQGLQ